MRKQVKEVAVLCATPHSVYNALQEEAGLPKPGTGTEDAYSMLVYQSWWGFSTKKRT